MKKEISKIVILVIVAISIFNIGGCQKKSKHKWIEVGATTDNTPITPGVHPERGTVSDATPMILASIYYPVGMDKNGKRQYKKYMYDIDELTPENINYALMDMGVIDDKSLFCDLVLSEADEYLNVGPGGAVGEKLTKKGTVRYVDLSTNIDNSDQYEGKYYVADLEGLIDMDDVLHCITQTFEENFQLVSCDIEPVSMDVYNEVHNGK